MRLAAKQTKEWVKSKKFKSPSTSKNKCFVRKVKRLKTKNSFVFEIVFSESFADFNPILFNSSNHSTRKGWNLTAEATGVVAVLSGPFGVGGQAGILPIAQAISQQVHAAVSDVRWSCKWIHQSQAVSPTIYFTFFFFLLFSLFTEVILDWSEDYTILWVPIYGGKYNIKTIANWNNNNKNQANPNLSWHIQIYTYLYSGKNMHNMVYPQAQSYIHQNFISHTKAHMHAHALTHSHIVRIHLHLNFSNCQTESTVKCKSSNRIYCQM